VHAEQGRGAASGHGGGPIGERQVADRLNRIAFWLVEDALHVGHGGLRDGPGLSVPLG
jgi:hypothetical protein